MSISVQPCLERDFSYEILDVSEKDSPLQIAMNSINKFLNKDPDGNTPLIVIEGPFGAGKTQLLLSIFKCLWKGGTVVLYTKMEDLYNDLVNLSSSSLREKLETLLDQKRKDILANLNNRFNSNLYLPIYVCDSDPFSLTVEDFFKKIIGPNISVKEIIEEKEWPIVLLIDEVENGYDKFEKLLGKRSLRDFIDEISMSKKILLVMGFGRRSLYDVFLASLKDESVLRRIQIISIPTFLPEAYHNLLQQRKNSNTLWWITRGRLGWVSVVLTDLPEEEDINSLISLDQKPLFKKNMMSNIPLIYYNQLKNIEEKYCKGDSTCVAAIRYLLLNIYPNKFSELPDFVKNNVKRKISPIISACSKLININDFIEDLIQDVEGKTTSLDNDTRYMLRDALRKILSSFSAHNTDSEEICLGSLGIENLSKYIYGESYGNTRFNGIIDSLIDMTLNLIFDEHGIVFNDTTKKLAEILEKFKNSKDSLKNDQTLKFYNRIKDVTVQGVSSNEDFFVELSPTIVETLFPFPISNPIVDKDIKDNVELENRLEDHFIKTKEEIIVEEINDFTSKILEPSEIDENKFYVVPIPQDLTKLGNKLKAIIEGIIEKSEVLDKNPKYVHIIISSKEDTEVNNIIESNLALRFLKKTGYLNIVKVSDDLLNDFIKSYYLLYLKNFQNVDDEVLKQRIDYYKLVLSQFSKDKIIRRPSVEKTLNISKVCIGDIINVMNRVTSKNPRTKLSTLLLLAYSHSEESLLGKIQYLLSDKRILDVDTLPTIYREGFTRQVKRPDGASSGETCASFVNSMNNDEIFRLLIDAAVYRVSLALGQKIDEPLSDCIMDTIFNSPPLFPYFYKIYNLIGDSDLQGNERDESMKYIYSMLLYYNYVTQKIIGENEYFNSIIQKTNEIMNSLNSKIQYTCNILDSINREIRDINQCPHSIMNITNFNIVSAGGNKLDVELGELKTLINSVKQLNSDQMSLENKLDLLFISSVGSDEKHLSFYMYADSIEKLNKELKNLNSSINKLKSLNCNLQLEILPRRDIELNIVYSQTKKDDEKGIAGASENIGKILDLSEEIIKRYGKIETERKKIKETISEIRKEWGELSE